MREDKLVMLGIAGLFVAILVINLWPVLVGVLAFIGAYTIWNSNRR